MDIDTLRTI